MNEELCPKCGCPMVKHEQYVFGDPALGVSAMWWKCPECDYAEVAQ